MIADRDLYRRDGTSDLEIGGRLVDGPDAAR
jgi:hypothetical protein